MNAKTIQKYEKMKSQNLHLNAKKWFNRFIRLRDTDENGFGVCISTGQRLKFGTESAQAGHFFSGGRYKSLEFNEDNVHLQRKSDNYFGHDFAAYAVNLKEKIGADRYEAICDIAANEKRHGFKQDRFMMIEIIETYKQKCKEIEKTKMCKL